MKKIYSAPRTELLTIRIEQHLLAGSPDAALNSQNEIEEGDFASRGSSVWFDDDSEDY